MHKNALFFEKNWKIIAAFQDQDEDQDLKEMFLRLVLRPRPILRTTSLVWVLNQNVSLIECYAQQYFGCFIFL